MDKHISVKAVANVKLTAGGFLRNIGFGQGFDGVSDLFFGNALQLELVSSKLDPKLSSEKRAVKGNAKRSILQNDVDEVKYETDIEIPENLGEIGAILVTNEHNKEMYLQDIVLNGLPQGDVTINCESWIHSKHDNPDSRVFFIHKPCLPSQTPAGLKELRGKELQNLRGNGEEERKSFDRIYDYAPYNDLGNPDNKSELGRPVLGTNEHPYPRRCRTGRSPTETEPKSESRSGKFYVPRDEDFSDVKQLTFGISVLDNVLNSLIPGIEGIFENAAQGFPTFRAIQDLFNDGIKLPNNMNNMNDMTKMLPDLLDQTKGFLVFPNPDMIQRDEFSWFRDDEFARETLAGLNPYSIKLVTEWPIKSKLDPKIYGPQESAFTLQLIEHELKDFMSVNKAVEQKKLFMLDYHDLFLPYVNKVRELKGTTLYGSRTLFFLRPDGTLNPVAIELTRPPSEDGKKPQWKQVYTPTGDVTQSWLWRLAKAHVLAHDSGYHQLISHWLRTHCCTEPYIIATNRQLSAMHPINKLLIPYFRFTMEINALARRSLINAGGIIETTFSPKKYSMEISSVVYHQSWRFDQQALPADLISRGMAVEDPSAPHGLKLTIEDYPFANDGLILWDAIKQWVTEYVTHYYPEEALVQSDQELQAWWEEIKNEGHKDKKDEPGWPTLKTPNDLIGILATIIWVSSGHHAAVNFGQYTYAAYFPNRPTIARIKMPSEDPTDEEWNNFLQKPHDVLLETFPAQIQALKVMAVLSVLSTHSPDEEYIGDQIEPSWANNPKIKEAFARFNGNLKELEKIIDERNANVKLKNRNGAGTVPYQLLKPFSKSGVTGMGVPNSISI